MQSSRALLLKHVSTTVELRMQIVAGRETVVQKSEAGELVSLDGLQKSRKVLVIGLDCAAPELVFDRWRDDLPCLKSLMDHGIYGRLQSTIPPITVPAWMSMMTGKDPGQLGFYGFRNRSSYDYDKLSFVTSQSVKEDTVWDILSRRGRRVVAVGVPPSYPPKPVNGIMVSCFLTPDRHSQFTYPADLKGEIEGLVGDYPFDVENFRTEDKADLLRRIYEMTEKRFKVIRYLMEKKPWDFFMAVEIGPDRIHHGFWKYWDKGHPKYQPGSPYEHAIKEYYRYLDGEVASLLTLVDDNTVVLVVSDHGAKRMDGGICVNEWLVQEGYLRLKERPRGLVRIDEAGIDWARTTAWAEGGYYARLFLNVKGREPQGIVEPAEYERVRDNLIERLAGLTDEKGGPLATKVFKPQDVYKTCSGVPPDLIVYLGDLYWRALATVGHDKIHVFENDTGPDDANHAEHGIFILYDPQRKATGERDGLHIMDCAPTILSLFGIPIPADMGGRIVR